MAKKEEDKPKKKKKKSPKSRTQEQGRNLMKHAEQNGIPLKGHKIKGQATMLLVPEGVDPMTGRALKDKRGRGPEDQGGRPITSMDPKQIRARARRRGHMGKEDIEALYQKPIHTWDLEELARGRPRNARGKFSGPAPSWITREMQEEIYDRFKQDVKAEMSRLAIPSMKVLKEMLDDDRLDSRGKPVVPPSVKVNIAQYLLEHVVGKPKQQVEADVSIKLQGILANVMVNPTPEDSGPFAGIPGMPGYARAALSAPVIEADVIDDEDKVGGSE